MVVTFLNACKICVQFSDEENISYSDTPPRTTKVHFPGTNALHNLKLFSFSNVQLFKTVRFKQPHSREACVL